MVSAKLNNRRPKYELRPQCISTLSSSNIQRYSCIRSDAYVVFTHSFCKTASENVFVLNSLFKTTTFHCEQKWRAVCDECELDSLKHEQQCSPSFSCHIPKLPPPDDVSHRLLCLTHSNSSRGV